MIKFDFATLGRTAAMRLQLALRQRHSGWIMGRVACLGIDVFKRLGSRLPLVNTQKGRVDVLMDFHSGTLRRPSAMSVGRYFARQDVVPLISQQQIFKWPATVPPSVLLMDSYAELTDQLFVERGGRREAFCANYSDVVHSEEFTARYECRGLLPCEEIEGRYRDFFTFLRREVGQFPIIFLHFPKDLETREKFRARHDAIASAISRLAEEFSPFHSIMLPFGTVRRSEADLVAFPYHYDANTYTRFAAEIGLRGLVF